MMAGLDLGTYKRLRPGASGLFTGIVGASSRAEAKARGLLHYSTGNPCKRGHVAERFTSTGDCVECKKAHREAWKEANPDKVKAQVKAKRARQRAEGLKGESTARHDAGPRCPGWIRSDPTAIRQMRELYRIAHALGWHVDHVVPLRGEEVSGLHVPWNLCLRPSYANEAKGKTHADSHPEADALTAAALLHLTFQAVPVTAAAAAALQVR